MPSFAPTASKVPSGEYLTTLSIFLNFRLCLTWISMSLLSKLDMRKVLTTPAYVNNARGKFLKGKARIKDTDRLCDVVFQIAIAEIWNFVRSKNFRAV